MAFCSNCGNKLRYGAKFCPSCGMETNGEDGSQRKQIYEGRIHKCPNCGEILKSFTAVCPSCGHEFRDIKSSGAVKEFADKLEQIQKNRKPESIMSSVVKAFGVEREDPADQQIAYLIRNFSVPNTKEDMFEFMILASSNIDASVLSKNGNTDDMSADELKAQKAIVEAWIAKANQVYQKAALAFGNDSDFYRIQQIYDQKMQETKKAKIWAWLMPMLPVGVMILMVMISFAMLGRYEREEKRIEKRLNAVVAEIQQDIKSGEYEDALIKANSLRFDKSVDSKKAEQWDEQREYLIDVIEKAKGDK